MKEKPPELNQIRDIIEREYATPPIVSGKCWEERATAGIDELLEPLIQQAKAEVAREIFGGIERESETHFNSFYDIKIIKPRYQSLKSKYVEVNDGS